MTLRWTQDSYVYYDRFFTGVSKNHLTENGGHIFDVSWALSKVVKEIVTHDAYHHGVADTCRVRFTISHPTYTFNGHSVDGRRLWVKDFLQSNIKFTRVFQLFEDLIQSNNDRSLDGHTEITVQYINFGAANYWMKRKRVIEVYDYINSDDEMETRVSRRK